MKFSKKLIVGIIGLIVFGAITPFPYNLGVLGIAVFLFVWGIKRERKPQQNRNEITP